MITTKDSVQGRKYLRAIARARMEKAGIPHINRPRRDCKGHLIASYFAANWKEWAAKVVKTAKKRRIKR